MDANTQLPMKLRNPSLRLSCLTSMLVFLASCQSTPFADRPGFESPEAAIEAVVVALRADDMAQLQAILGPDSEELLDSGHAADDREGRDRFLELYDESHAIEMAGAQMATLHLGVQESPFPIPLVRSGETWFLDTEQGFEELIYRRIGRNELGTVNVCHAFAEAELEYVRKDHNGDGIFEYARKIRSSANEHDGLYWLAAPGESESPLGELLASAEADVRVPTEARTAYHGYRYRLLKAQGEHATGGAYGYMAGDYMIGGFALVAYPASYAETGVMTFIVNHWGIVHEADLGPETEKRAQAMTSFDPDAEWTVTADQ
ncbi:MAG: hypothetical protein ACI8QZ_000802 [Chlamydiales bacterium]|jgi:hypothetical protein